MTQVPPRALVVGGGAVGVEFSIVLAGLRSPAALLVRGDTLLRNCEPEARELVAYTAASTLALTACTQSVIGPESMTATNGPAGSPVPRVDRGRVIVVAV
jgi:pyruvate/2-oxoglutarate dehydrogenase complex dihydrolipoamide dehydrogenase (E3) component